MKRLKTLLSLISYKLGINPMYYVSELNTNTPNTYNENGFTFESENKHGVKEKHSFRMSKPLTQKDINQMTESYAEYKF
jgi:hypothetical protein